MIAPSLQVLLHGAYESFTTELVTACTRVPFAVQFHQMSPDVEHDLASLVGGSAAVLLYGDAAEMPPRPVELPGDLDLPVLVLGPPDSARQHAWKAAGAYRYLADADADELAEALMAVYQSQRATHSKAQLEEAAAAVPMQTLLLSEMSHEIRTPLTTILGFAEVLAQSTEGEEQVLATMIMQGGQRLSNIVNSVLDLAYVDAGQQPLKRERVDVAAEVAEAVSFFVPQAMEKDLDLHVEPPSTPTWADFDVALLTRVVNNLVGNAVKYTDAGHIRVAVAVTDTTLMLTVADTGTGIDATFMPDLFNAFRRGNRSYRRRGSGLGLAITQRLVHLAGGTIAVETELGEGTTFAVTFPRFADSPRLPRSIARGMAAGWQPATSSSRTSASISSTTSASSMSSHSMSSAVSLNFQPEETCADGCASILS